MHGVRSWTFCLAAAWLLAAATPAFADTVHLTNGDTITGKVILLDENKLKVQSEALGELTIQRAKVASIHLGEAKPPVVQAKPAASLNPAVPAIPSVDDVLKQLQQGGLNADALKQLQEQVPALAHPQVQEAFQKRLVGLMTGKMTLDDLRKEAEEARDQIKKLKQDLGPEADALDGYLNILESFLRKTAPSKPAKP